MYATKNRLTQHIVVARLLTVCNNIGPKSPCF